MGKGFTNLVAVLAMAILCFSLLGCDSKDEMVVGRWAVKNGGTITAKPDHTWSMPLMTNITFDGTWSIDGDDVVFTPVSVAGKSVAEMRPRMLEFADHMETGAPAEKAFANDMEKQRFYRLSPDGKTMTTDKAKDQGTGPSRTYTKQ